MPLHCANLRYHFAHSKLGTCRDNIFGTKRVSLFLCLHSYSKNFKLRFRSLSSRNLPSSQNMPSTSTYHTSLNHKDQIIQTAMDGVTYQVAKTCHQYQHIKKSPSITKDQNIWLELHNGHFSSKLFVWHKHVLTGIEKIGSSPNYWD